MKAAAIPKDKCPYLGLEAFVEGRSDLYFGREDLLEVLIDKLGAPTELLVITGPADGDGSLLVLGGLLPALRLQGRLPGSKSWRYLPVVTPGPEPLADLAAASAPRDLADKREFVRQKVAGLRADPGYLSQELARDGGKHTFLVVDRFEDLFTVARRDDDRRDFLDNLAAMIRCKAPRHRVVITMRAESYAQVPQEAASFFQRFEVATVEVRPPGAAELRNAIREPSERVGLHFKEGLVEALADEPTGDPCGMTLLQDMLMEALEPRRRRCRRWDRLQSRREPPRSNRHQGRAVVSGSR